MSDIRLAYWEPAPGAEPCPHCGEDASEASGSIIGRWGWYDASDGVRVTFHGEYRHHSDYEADRGQLRDMTREEAASLIAEYAAKRWGAPAFLVAYAESGTLPDWG